MKSRFSHSNLRCLFPERNVYFTGYDLKRLLPNSLPLRQNQGADPVCCSASAREFSQLQECSNSQACPWAPCLGRLQAERAWPVRLAWEMMGHEGIAPWCRSAPRPEDWGECLRWAGSVPPQTAALTPPPARVLQAVGLTALPGPAASRSLMQSQPAVRSLCLLQQHFHGQTTSRPLGLCGAGPRPCFCQLSQDTSRGVLTSLMSLHEDGSPHLAQHKPCHMGLPGRFEPAESLCWTSMLCHAAAVLWIQY